MMYQALVGKRETGEILAVYHAKDFAGLEKAVYNDENLISYNQELRELLGEDTYIGLPYMVNNPDFFIRVNKVELVRFSKKEIVIVEKKTDSE